MRDVDKASAFTPSLNELISLIWFKKTYARILKPYKEYKNLLCGSKFLMVQKTGSRSKLKNKTIKNIIKVCTTGVVQL